MTRIRVSNLLGFAVRLNSDFTPDPTFGTAGIATLNWSEFYSSAALQPDGKILIGGGEATNGLATLGRLNANGSLDTTFGSGGSVSTVFNVPAGGDFGITSSFSSVFVESDGKIVAIGSADDVGAIGGYFTAEARYNSDGSPDTTFGDGGSRWFSIGGDGNDYGAGAVALPNGDIAIAATSDNLPVLASILTVGTQATPTITWANPGEHRLRDGAGRRSSTRRAVIVRQRRVPGTFAYSPAAGTVLGRGRDQTLSVTFTPTDTTDYTTATDTVTIDVIAGDADDHLGQPASIVYGTALSAHAARCHGVVDVGRSTGAWPGPSPTRRPRAPCSMRATTRPSRSPSRPPTRPITPPPPPRRRSTCRRPTPTITWANPPSIVYGTALSATQLDATASWTLGADGERGRDLHLHAGRGHGPHGGRRPDPVGQPSRPPTPTDYTSTSPTATINVAQATPTITWANPADITYGTPLGPVQLDATASVPGSFVYTPAAKTTLNSGAGQALSVTFTPTDAADYNPVKTTTTINVLPAPQKATPIITWPDPAAIAYGTALGAAQLDATAAFGGTAVAGTFTYTPGPGTVLNAGPGQTLSVSFTPDDTTDYRSTTATAMINVAQATPTITWADPAGIVFGTSLGAAQLDATASVPGVFTYTPAAGTVLNAGANQMLTVTFTPDRHAAITPPPPAQRPSTSTLRRWSEWPVSRSRPCI